ncbi:MAG: gliding motility-associated C-terminal domain-containing protein [Flavobacteriaceae bacterium]|jgi:gliding motility-associated-like protein|nr:gliding motility-associated C-terminal domain-containing protein [Flavobacteriaceae bacterium]
MNKKIGLLGISLMSWFITCVGYAKNSDLTESCDVYNKAELNDEYRYNLIQELVKKPNDLNICRHSITNTVLVDLTNATDKMFENEGVDEKNYILTYFEKENESNKIANPQSYLVNNVGVIRTIYLKIEDIRTGESIMYTFKLIPTEGEYPQKKEDIIRCLSYQLPELNKGEFYFEKSAGKGKQFKVGDVFYEGIYKIYILKDNGGDCYEEQSLKIEVYAMSKAQSFDDQVLTCKLYILEPLPRNNKYYTEVKGRRVEQKPGTTIKESGTRVWVVGTSDNGYCTNETSFTVTYKECPIPKGFSPNGDGINDFFDLSYHNVTDLKIYNRVGIEVYSYKGAYSKQWDGKTNSGKDLPSGTYYYVIQAYDKTKTGWVELNR